ncbi:MAG TPA: methionine adenosyltransferase [Candidatus Scatovivens faecipullorum]|nr:methionine adenosyltransferase [Candidatus Scatovivens faecipullorum]
MRRLFTSESVTEGHPDKLCDFISDSILDAYLEKDPYSRVACETVAGKGQILVTGEITSNAEIDIEKIVRNTIKDVGFDNEKTDIDYKTCKVLLNISKQSSDIALGVDKSLEQKEGSKEESEGAGDQGMMFGFATDETDEYMPMPIYLAHKLSKRLTEVRKEKIIDYIRPDGKVQVTVEYEKDSPKRIDTIVISTQHNENVDLNKLKKDIISNVVKPIVPEELLDNSTKYYINPTGRFVIGGPLGDSGLTGRKIIVDTYGGYSRHGGGAFSGKDPTKVDRSAAYMARFVAKNIVANGFAKKCEIQLSYAIGVAKPISIYVDTFGTGKIPDNEIVKKIKNTFKLTPRGIIESLDLRRPIYRKTTNYGHFGKKDLPWEKIIKLV